MATSNGMVLHEAFWATEGQALWLKRALLVLGGIAALALTAKVNIQIGDQPVPVTLTTFTVLSIGAAYGARLGFVTMFGYMLVGAAGFDVFAKSTADLNGLEYMMGSTGGYLVGYLLATIALGYLARKGWDRNVGKMSLGMLIGNVLIYVPGLAWLAVLYGTDAPILEWGLTPFLLGDGIKLVLAALIFPAVWAMVGKART